MLVLALLAFADSCRRPLAVEKVPDPAVDARPNIVVILADDMRYDDLPHMIKTLSWFTLGTNFTHAFVSLAHCCPSRTTLLRGQYAHNHGVMDSHDGFLKAYVRGIEESTVATWLHDAYRTAFFGKYLNGYPFGAGNLFYVPPGWDEWHAFAGLPAYVNYQLEDHDSIIAFGDSVGAYSTDVLARYAAAFLRTSTQPFFAEIAPYAPHNPFPVDPERYRGDFQQTPFPESPSWEEADVSDKPLCIRNLVPDSTPPTYIYRHRQRALEALDDLVDSVMTTLQARGVLENTVVFFTSDNGVHIGEHRMPLDKGTPYEEDIRVPLLVVGSGVLARTVDNLATNVDLAPTIAAFARESTPAFVDGQNLRPFLLGNSDVTRNAFMIEVPDLAIDYPQAQAVRTMWWKYTERATGEVELYNLRFDPYELRNIAGTRPYIQSQLASWLEAYRTCRAATCRALDARTLR